MICKKCRNNVKTDFKYCPYCGERVISDFHESYGELTPPFIIEDQNHDDETVKFYAPDPMEKQPDFDRYSSAPPSAGGTQQPDGVFETAPRSYEAAAGVHQAGAKPESSYFVYPEELIYGSVDDPKREDDYAYEASPAADYRYDMPKSEPRYEAPKPEPIYEAPRSEPIYEAPKPEPRYEAPRSEPIYEAPKPEPRYEAPRSEPRYEAPKPKPRYVAPSPEPRYNASAASEPYYVYGGAAHQETNGQDGYSESSPRGNAERQRATGEDISFDVPDQCIQIDMSFSEPESVPAGQANRADDGAPYYVYGRDVDSERENVLPFDEEFSQELLLARAKQSGSTIAAKLALILLIAVLAVAVSIFGYRYVAGLSDKDAWIAGNTSSASGQSSNASEPSSSASKSSSSVSGQSSSASEPSSSTSQPSLSVSEPASAASKL